TSEAVEDPAYFMAYDLVRVESLWLEANDGALDKRHIDDDRTVDVDVRVGDPLLDNGHPTNGFYGGNGLGTGVQVSLADDPLSLAQALWMVTELQYQDAVESWIEAVSSESMLTREDELVHPDFTLVEQPLVHVEARRQVDLEAIAEQWAPVVTKLSAILDADPVIQQAAAVLNAEVENRSYVDTEGARVQSNRVRVRLMMIVSAQAADG